MPQCIKTNPIHQQDKIEKKRNNKPNHPPVTTPMTQDSAYNPLQQISNPDLLTKWLSLCRLEKLAQPLIERGLLGQALWEAVEGVL